MMGGQDERQLLNAVLREDLGAFVHKVFQTVSSGDTYLPNWHIDAIVYRLTQVRDGEIRRLVITQPPRSLKSICTSVAFVAWAMGHDPKLRFICVSYSTELANTLSRHFRLVVESDWYRELFPRMRIAKLTESEITTTAGGGRSAVTVGGTLTGRGADIIVIDDPMKAEEAQSETTRRRVKEWYGNTLLSRLNDKKTGSILLVMQRLHEDDLAGHLLESGEKTRSEKGVWTRLDLSAIAEQDEEIPIGPHNVHTRREGEALHPERESVEMLEKIRAEMGSLAFSAQYQQRPMPTEGNLVKREWLDNRYETEPEGLQIVQSWDVASTTGENNDWSVCTTWAMRNRSYWLLDVWRGRLNFPDLKRKVEALARQHNPSRILIEDAGPGMHLLQEFRNNTPQGIPRPIGITPVGSKEERLDAQTARFEAKQVLLPTDAPWLSDFQHELLAFPNARHDDQVDSVTQFLAWAEKHRNRGPRVSTYSELIEPDEPDYW
ncbi:putative phage terminase large subunit-like protein [Parvibaculum indicum]|uniref:phage terminase large subunit n=1 Tax=Parvibaculum indicum TaxID=562969 RepID=UPI001421BCC7|nr:phage terminase large subunit [Parvibaculum indicum]NIJ43500.1 putative phage terminase large subunit-like protein [Parvibaculum indicum]